jgi:hypothetical protein
MAFGEITATDLNSWQYRAMEVLADIVKDGLQAERYPLNWSVTTNGSVRGEVSRYQPRQTDSDRRALFAEWVDALGAGQPREFKRSAGDSRMTALFTRQTNRGEVQGALEVEFDAPEDGLSEDSARD